MRRLTALALLTLILTGCTTPAPQPTPIPTPTSAPQAERTDVDWTQYPPDAQRLIDEAETAGDCEALQGTFDVAAQAGFLDQMNYIDEALRLADCY